MEFREALREWEEEVKMNKKILQALGYSGLGLIIISGRVKRGQSTRMICLIYDAAANQKTPVGIFSLAMNAKQFMNAACECGHRMTDVSNGWFGTALFCVKCENIYELKLIKVAQKRIGAGFLGQCRGWAEANRQV